MSIERENEQKIYLWKLIHVMYDGQHEEVVNWGVSESCIEMFVDNVIPSLNTSIDRDMWEMQDELDRIYPDKRYRFEYKEIDIELNDLGVV